MNMKFYLVVFVVLLGVIGTMFTGHYFFNKWLERRATRQQLEDEARQIAETNSGL